MLSTRTYRVFDVRLRSSIPLPGLRESADGEADFEFRLLPPAQLDDSGFQWFHQWKDAAGRVITAGARRGDSIRLIFPGAADFLVDLSAHRITGFARADVSAETLAHLVLDQVMPRLLTHLGRPVVHASAVVSTGGVAVAFLGNSGYGKSTLAAAFLRAGWEVLGDDCLLLEQQGGCLLAKPAYPSLRLWSDSQAQLFPGGDGFRAMADYSAKQQRLIAANGPRRAARAQPLSALFVLNDPRAAPAAAPIAIGPVTGQRAVIGLLEALFALDPTDKQRAKRHFEWATDIARSNARLLTLDYPRRFEKLGAVVDVVSQWLQSAAGTSQHFLPEALRPPR